MAAEWVKRSIKGNFAAVLDRAENKSMLKDEDL